MKASIPIASGYFAVSAAYGMAAIVQGMSVTQAVMTSLTNLTSAGQFSGTTLICAQASLIELVLTQLVINARYFLMSISLAQKTGDKMPLKKRLIMSFGITDEIYAVAISQKGPVKFVWFLGLMIPPIIGWTLGTLLGASASSALPDQIVNALGLAMYGMFIAIFVPVARKERPILYCVLLTTLVSVGINMIPALKQVSSGYTLILITIAISAFMAWRFPRENADQNDDMESEEE
ncbi:MAG: AzlC family ABC transporter permease [Erysipelotrichaceae bacterium]|nr:AzlC family ABC transporter permease [Erysipelotrichaceae bacterium]